MFGDYAVYLGSTASVKSKLPNALGLFDMSGNVAELVFYCDSDFSPPMRLRRGGDWSNNVWGLPIGINDDFTTPGTESNNIGFRFAKSK